MNVTQRIYQYIQQYIAAYEEAPLEREIADEVGLHPSAICYHLKRLKTTGFIDYDRRWRSIKVLDSTGKPMHPDELYRRVFGNEEEDA